MGSVVVVVDIATGGRSSVEMVFFRRFVLLFYFPFLCLDARGETCDARGGGGLPGGYEPFFNSRSACCFHPLI